MYQHFLLLLCSSSLLRVKCLLTGTQVLEKNQISEYFERECQNLDNLFEIGFFCPSDGAAIF